MSVRTTILEIAAHLVSGEREGQHGDPNIQLGVANELASVLTYAINNHGRRTVSGPERAALMLICTKLSRVVCGSYNPDNYIDLCGYAALAGEAAANDLNSVEVAGPKEPVNA